MKNIYRALTAVLLTFSLLPAQAETTGLREALRYSDDIEEYLEEFILASEKLISSKGCSVQGFERAGGWAKATGSNWSRPVYFTYCNNLTIPNRWYVNILTGHIYQ